MEAREDSCGSLSRSSSSSSVASDGDAAPAEERALATLPLRRRRRRERSAAGDMREGDGIDWLGRFRSNPLVSGLIGVAHVVGLHRPASELEVSRYGSGLSLGDYDERDERDSGEFFSSKSRARTLSDDFGFFVAITPTGTPACDDGYALSSQSPWAAAAAYS